MSSACRSGAANASQPEPDLLPRWLATVDLTAFKGSAPVVKRLFDHLQIARETNEDGLRRTMSDFR